MSLPSAVPLCVGCSDGPANIFWLARGVRKELAADDHHH
jgi:hypothetical protein